MITSTLTGSCVTIFDRPSTFGNHRGRNERFTTARRKRIMHARINESCSPCQRVRRHLLTGVLLGWRLEGFVRRFFRRFSEQST